MSKSIVFIDSHVAGYETLIEGLEAGTEWFLLNAQEDGVAQMQRTLTNYKSLDSIQVISHGSAGALYLGSTVLNSDNLYTYDSELKAIGSSLSATGDLLLYGCNVAQGEVGLNFVTALAVATRADVAASSDATGAAALGGNAVLEMTMGIVSTPSLALNELSGLLAVNTAPTFTVGDGKLTTDLGLKDTGQSVTLQTDGKILVTGNSYDSSTGFRYLSLARYNTNGTLDTSFDADGKLTTDFGSSNYLSSGQSITLQADSKILVAGYSGSYSIRDFALARYNASGSLDTSFDNDGKLTTDFGATEQGQSITLQADGKILVAGYSGDDFALARYNANGSLDTSFDSDGKLTTHFGPSNYLGGGQSITLQADGKILVAGYSSDTYGICDFALARYNANGSLDTSFDTDGKVTADIGKNNAYLSDIAYDLTLQADGKIVLAGASGNDFALVRFNANGSPDISFSPAENTLDNRPSFIELRSEYYDGLRPAVLDPDVQIFDTELASAGHYSEAILTLTRHGGANVQDVFSSSGSAVSALNTGGYFSVNSVSIGRVTSNDSGSLVLSFNSNATQALVNQAMQSIAYANTSNAPPATVQIDWTFSDGNTGTQGTGGALSVTGSTTVDIIAINDAPLTSYSLPDRTLTTDVPFTYVLPAGAFTDPDLEALSYSVVLSDGAGVPPWLTINSATGTLSGTPDPMDVGTFSLRITACDSSGSTVSDDFQLTVATPSRVLNGTLGADKLVSLGDDEVLNGLGGNDTLDGGAGNVNLLGGDGSDTYYVRDAGDIVTETNASASTGGTDTVYSYLNAYTLTANVENGRIMNSTAANLSGNGLNNLLYAGAGDNVLDGDTGTDTLSYAYAKVGITASLATALPQETEGSGIDTLRNIENLTGSAFDDTLTGNAASNTLNGGAGADMLMGRDGSDVYYVDNEGDWVRETNATASIDGLDTVNSFLAAYTLTANVENGRILSTTVANLTGNSLSNVLFAGAGNNIINGGTGTDTVSYLYGLMSGSTTGVNASLLSGLVTGSSGSDTLSSMENLTGSGLNDTLVGSAGNNVLDGGVGNDTMNGGDGSDTYCVGSIGDSVVEINAASAGGTDTVVSTITHILGLNVENLTLLGTTAITGIGNALANVITGNAASNTLTGGASADKFVFSTMLGATNIDTLTDFKVSGADKVLLDDDIFTTLGITGTTVGAALTASKFQLGTIANDAGDRIIYDQSLGKLYYDADGTGATAQVQIALIGTSTHAAMTVTDFLVIA